MTAGCSREPVQEKCNWDLLVCMKQFKPWGAEVWCCYDPPEVKVKCCNIILPTERRGCHPDLGCRTFCNSCVPPGFSQPPEEAGPERGVDAGRDLVLELGIGEDATRDRAQ
jgi:hypothetical protein